jgi:hypothetical protein
VIPFPLEVHLYHWFGLSAQFRTICSVELHCNSLHHNYTCRFLRASMMNLLSCVKCTLLCFLSNMTHWYISSSKSFWWLVLFSIWFSYIRISGFLDTYHVCCFFLLSIFFMLPSTLFNLKLFFVSPSILFVFDTLFCYDDTQCFLLFYWQCATWLTLIVPTSMTAYLYLYSHGEVSLAASQPV